MRTRGSHMSIFSATEAPTFAQAPLLFCRSELADSEVVQLHRGCAISHGETAWERIGISGVRLNDRATGAMAMAGLAVDGLTGIGDEWGPIPGASALSSRALSWSRASSLVARSWSSLSFV